MKEVTVQELKEKRESNEDFFLLDVREDVEYLVSNLDGEHIPLGQLENRMKEIEDKKNEEVIVMCRSGGRSSKAVSYLANNGFENVANLKGGMKAWASEIDPSVPVA
ncbi:MAG: rhodanese-like domain-containing protein [Gracilimonas sp.]|uniref:rhodanese-like domain-containing protein n=1 Tax=Gracilimonas TaxID=649462 RepID=UPI001B23070E|nr:rhodanese-like domain-containing protein [Gracilimonas sp.]MBO6584914.1 rhodanese-like domain-containing protein [Gracilimonas sp.]MBO6615815.1 rhodanese-like domain-containing protein [Gracilimonas sp.]